MTVVTPLLARPNDSDFPRHNMPDAVRAQRNDSVTTQAAAGGAFLDRQDDEFDSLHSSQVHAQLKVLGYKNLVELRENLRPVLLRLQKHLFMCRMSADGTFLVDKQAPGYSSKLEELERDAAMTCGIG